MPERDRVFVDANELFPFRVMDIVLALAGDLFVWTDELLDEWERVIVGRGSGRPGRPVPCQRPYQRFEHRTVQGRP